jgi:cysteine-rich repeat protein
MPRTPRIPVLLLSLVPGCFSPNDGVIVSDGGGGESDGSADSTGGTTMGSGMTGPGATEPGDTTEDPSATTGEVSDTEADTTGGAPVCGNGEVEGDEVCDDGVNDGGYGGCTADCSALGPHCGDDAVQGAEDCDDGDDENGDGCNIDCTISGELVWRRTFESAGAYGIAVDADDNAVITTYEADSRLYDTAGAPGWVTGYSVPSSSVTHGEAVAFDGVDWLVAGAATVASQGSNVWWRRIDADGGVGAGSTYDNPDHTNDRLAHVAFDSEGNLFVAGTIDDSGASDDASVWVRKFDPAGAELWSRTFDDGLDDSAEGLAAAPDGGVVVSGSTEVNGQSANAWLRKYDAEGTIEWTRSSNGEGSASDVYYGVAVGSDGAVAAVGLESDDIVVVTVQAA